MIVIIKKNCIDYYYYYKDDDDDEDADLQILNFKWFSKVLMIVLKLPLNYNVLF